jgi:hypothetical protein
VQLDDKFSKGNELGSFVMQCHHSPFFDRPQTMMVPPPLAKVANFNPYSTLGVVVQGIAPAVTYATGQITFLLPVRTGGRKARTACG